MPRPASPPDRPFAGVLVAVLLAVLLLAATAPAADSADRKVRSEARAIRDYDACMQRVHEQPDAALESALAWEQAGGGQRFGFEGELLESAAPYREVTSERMIGMDGPGTRNELTLTVVPAGTLLSLLITYPSAELRDSVLGTGMVDGMEASYARLESAVLTQI